MTRGGCPLMRPGFPGIPGAGLWRHRGPLSCVVGVRTRVAWGPAVPRSRRLASASLRIGLPRDLGARSHAERRLDLPNSWAPVLGDMSASRTRVRGKPRAAWGQRSRGPGVRPPAVQGPVVSCSGGLASIGMGASQALNQVAVVRQLGGWPPQRPGAPSHAERRPATTSPRDPVPGDMRASRTGV